MLEVRPSHGQNRERFRAALEKMPALRRQSGIGDYGACDSIQRSRLVRDGLRREEKQRRGRGKNGQNRHRKEKKGGEGGRDPRKKNGHERKEIQRNGRQ